MSVRTFAIVLDNPSGSYFSGQVVSGRVILDLEGERKTSGFKLNCSGKASVHWTESRTVSTGTGSNRRTRTETKHYNASENYFEFKIYLAGRSGGPEIILPAGQQVHPFNFQLPQGLPSSFQGNHGYVQYSLQGTIKKNWGFDKKATCPFTVNGILDLNTWGGAAAPATFTKTKHLGCCCCKSGPITINAKLARVGFVPGEGMEFLAEMINLSHKPVLGIQLRITRSVIFRAQGRTKTQSDRVTEFRGTGVAAGETEIFRPDPNIMRIPAVAPTNLAGCSIIGLQYQLEVELDMPSGHFNLKGSMPIIIGTIPFRNNFSQLMPQQPQPIGGTVDAPGQPMPSAPPLLPGYPDLPPPTYEASCPFGQKDSGASGGDLPTYGEAVKAEEDGKQPPPNAFDPNFVPKYATYGWGPPPGV